MQSYGPPAIPMYCGVPYVTSIQRVITTPPDARDPAQQRRIIYNPERTTINGVGDSKSKRGAE